jgi:hypothetical protein
MKDYSATSNLGNRSLVPTCKVLLLVVHGRGMGWDYGRDMANGRVPRGKEMAYQ